MKFFASASTLITIVVAAQSAFAQAPPPPPPAPPPGEAEVGAAAEKTSGPILPNMLPSRIGGTVDVRADYTYFGESSGLDLDVMLGFTLHGQYIAQQGYGGYVSIPYYYASFDDESDNGAGNLEVGGLYRLPQGAESEILLRGAFALDTAGNAGGLLSPFSQLAPRFYDAYPTGFAATWLKLEGSYRHSSGNLRLALSGGFDVPLGQDEGEFITINVDALGKAALSAGIENPGFSAAVGLVFLQTIGAEGDDESELGLNLTGSVPINPATALYFNFGLPALEDNLFDPPAGQDAFAVWALGAGVRAAIN